MINNDVADAIFFKVRSNECRRKLNCPEAISVAKKYQECAQKEDNWYVCFKVGLCFLSRT